MKRALLFLISVSLGSVLPAQEKTVDEAIQMMKESSREYLTTIFTKEDETGADQFVDVEIIGVHDFADYSYGALLPEFKAYLESIVPTVVNYRGVVKKSDRAGIIETQNARMVEYAGNNMTKIAAYSAIVDYDGVTKFKEKKSRSRLFLFDADGKVICLANAGDSRNLYKGRIVPHMVLKVERELTDMNDPLFLKKEYWVSETVTSTMNGRYFEMQWCYALTKENIDDPSMDRGSFRAYYYQIQKGAMTTIKSITLFMGTYEKSSSNIAFSYHDVSVESFHVKPEDTASFKPNYGYLPLDDLNHQHIETAKVRKYLHSLDNTPKSFIDNGDEGFTMTVPFYDGGAVRFTKLN